MKLYIAGPMSGIPKFNFPAFFAAGDKLREKGYEIINPAEMDDKEDKGAAMSSTDGRLGSGTGFGAKTWGDFLMRDVKIIADEVDGVAVLPGWMHSRGARLEVFIALSVQKPIISVESLEPLDPVNTAKLIAGFVVDQGDTSRYEAEA